MGILKKPKEKGDSSAWKGWDFQKYEKRSEKVKDRRTKYENAACMYLQKKYHKSFSPMDLWDFENKKINRWKPALTLIRIIYLDGPVPLIYTLTIFFHLLLFLWFKQNTNDSFNHLIFSVLVGLFFIWFAKRALGLILFMHKDTNYDMWRPMMGVLVSWIYSLINFGLFALVVWVSISDGDWDYLNLVVIFLIEGIIWALLGFFSLGNSEVESYLKHLKFWSEVKSGKPISGTRVGTCPKCNRYGIENGLCPNCGYDLVLDNPLPSWSNDPPY
jgi:rRNA maturation protein Nop10